MNGMISLLDLSDYRVFDVEYSIEEKRLKIKLMCNRLPPIKIEVDFYGIYNRNETAVSDARCIYHDHELSAGARIDLESDSADFAYFIKSKIFGDKTDEVQERDRFVFDIL